MPFLRLPTGSRPVSGRLAKVLPTLLLAPVLATAAPPVVDHAIEVRLDPAAGTLTASDRLTLPPDLRQVTLLLHADLAPVVSDGDALLEPTGRDGHLERFRLTTRDPGPVTLRYGGRIHHPLLTQAEGMGRERQQTIGSIDADGAYLTGFTGWYPRVPDSLERFALTVDLPAGWLAVSQGAGPAIVEDAGRVRVGWREEHPQDEVHLNAGRFRLYRAPGPVAEAQAWLRQPDDALAARYLAVTADYLQRYSDLIGPYPYAKFALVENFWESGYGMPSFTLLGPRVLRLPFILHTSYPHEILHNWWGNGVFVDYANGNWSEGLTTYLADYRNAEDEGRGADYRRDQLAAWADYVRTGADFPPRAFQGRHGGASQAIGYGKVMMIFHMLRLRLGDAAFLDGLRRFYADNRFRVAGWPQLEAAFSAASPSAAPDLAPFLSAWLGRTGAPTLNLSEVRQEPLPTGGWRVSARIAQTQAAAPFPLTLPLVIHDQTGGVHDLRLTMDGSTATLDFQHELPAPALRLAVDPAFDTFRTLLPGEAPVRLGALFGAAEGLIVLPAEASAPFADGYRTLAEAWSAGEPGWAIATDAELDALPTDRPVWLLGWENRFLEGFAALAGTRATLDPTRQAVTIAGQTYIGQSPVLTAAGADGGTPPRAWLAAATPGAAAGLARKLPHYGKQSYLVFDAAGAEALVKGQWPAGDSALVAEPPATSEPPAASEERRLNGD